MTTYLCPCERDGFECDHCRMKRLQREVADAQKVANWLHARLYDVSRLCLILAEDGSDLPRRDWLSFDNEPEACP